MGVYRGNAIVHDGLIRKQLIDEDGELRQWMRAVLPGFRGDSQRERTPQVLPGDDSAGESLHGQSSLMWTTNLRANEDYRE
jgi:hypothetical protein